MTELDELYRSAAGRFVHSAIVVDDRAALAPEDDEPVPGHVEDPRPRPSPADPDKSAADAADAKTQEARAARRGVAEENRLDAHALIDRFAELGIVCGVHRPGENAENTQTLVLAAGTRADIVILDWHLGDSGTRALELLNRLSTPEDARLRLICVYTGDGSSQVAESIGSLGAISPLDDRRFQRGSTRIVLLFKEGSEQIGAPPAQVITVGALPDRLIDEFALFCAGLVSSATMSSLGAVREAMPEILGVLGPNLDAAFVGQRLSQERPDDAVDHLAELVVSELQSIIEDDAGVAKAANEAAVRLWLAHRDGNQLSVERDALQEMNRIGGSKDARAKIADSYPQFSANKNRHPTRFVAEAADAERADARLAERMTTRHRYPGARPERLELGVVVRSPADNSCWLCVQPLCDSVRLTTKTRMPFLPYTTVAASKAFDLAVDQAGDGVLHLQLSVSPSDIELVEFEPDLAEKAILAKPFPEDGRAFLDTAQPEQRPWRLLCRLKAAHAQRIAHRLGNEFSRVGLNESEWLRIKAKG